MKEILENHGFVSCEKTDLAIAEFEVTNNPINLFYDELDEVDYLNEPIKSVYQRYSTFCLSNNLQALSAIEFSNQMKKHFNLVVRTVEQDGKRCRVYVDE